MTADPQDQAFDVPTSADASRILEEITPVTRRSRRLARDVALARPLLAWGRSQLGRQAQPGPPAQPEQREMCWPR